VKTKKMTKPQMRVAIAKDAIAQILSKNFKPVANKSYVELDRAMTPESMVLLAEQRKLKCTVCGLGAIFISSIAKFDDVEIPRGAAGVKHFICQISEKDHLLKFFGADQISNIEKAFEGWECYSHISQIPNDRARLLVILRNIVRNDGKFIPKKKDLSERKGGAA
jgi:hypothetical protein